MLHVKNADQDVWGIEKMKQPSGKYSLFAPNVSNSALLVAEERLQISRHRSMGPADAAVTSLGLVPCLCWSPPCTVPTVANDKPQDLLSRGE